MELADGFEGVGQAALTVSSNSRFFAGLAERAVLLSLKQVSRHVRDPEAHAVAQARAAEQARSRGREAAGCLTPRAADRAVAGGWPVAERSSRFFIGTGTTRYAEGPGFADRPGLAAEIDRMAGLFTKALGYQAVPGFGPDLPAGELKARLGRFLTDAARTDQDVLVFYYTGHAEFDGGDFVLPFPETTSDLARSGVWASELANWLFRGTASSHSAERQPQGRNVI